MGYIYKIINDINNKIYIGQTSYSIDYRFKQHCKDYSTRRFEHRPLYAAMNKYGIEHFKIELIEEVPNNLLNEREIYWIRYFHSYHYGYNATLGGDGKSFINQEEVINLYNILQNQTEVAKKLNISQDSVHNILKANNIYIISGHEVSKKVTGKPVIMFNKSEEKLQEFTTMKEAARYLKNNNKAKASVSSISYHISEVCRGLRKTAYGYKWKFLNEVEK